MKGLKIRFGTIEDSLEAVAMAFILFMMLLTTADIIGRYVFNSPIVGVTEIEEELMSVIVLLCLASIQRTNINVGVDLFEQAVKRKGHILIYHGIRIFNCLLPLVLYAIVSWSSFGRAMDAFAERLYFSGFLRLPSGPFLLSVPLGSVLLCIRLVIQIVNETRNKDSASIEVG
ncbi:MAG: TRAP transporter small permease [Chloroflexi bacterium]|nr:TRAP transporter small permease [Chloroflexota bacterium]